MSDHVISGTDAIFIDGPCPFLTCLETGPHGHDVCPDCGAVKFGNISCKTCRSHYPGGDPLGKWQREQRWSARLRRIKSAIASQG